jgi:hypothetical protein
MEEKRKTLFITLKKCGLSPLVSSSTGSCSPRHLKLTQLFAANFGGCGISDPFSFFFAFSLIPLLDLAGKPLERTQL